jgi:uracil-DNA glycosylase
MKLRIKSLNDNNLPYINGEAHGLSFSSIDKVTPSLQVIFKELKLEFNKERTNPNLTDWAEQGVLLLNSSLTTVKRKSRAHGNIGWEKFTGHALSMLARTVSPKVFMLWGKDAKAIGAKYIAPRMSNGNHLLLHAVHPQAENYSDGSWSFTGCNHFKRANEFLAERGKGRIKWI